MNKFEFLDRFNKEEKLDVDQVALTDFARQVGGILHTTQGGSYLEVIAEYNSDYCHGTTCLRSSLFRTSFNIDFFETECGLGEIEPARILFIDTETTGLSAASGTVAFLVGVGFVDQEKFKLHQFFLPDYPDEAAMLESVADLVAGKTYIASYNGKAFDLPLLETRYIMQRMSSPFKEMHHIDLLHSARRFFKGRFDNMTLQTLEKELLGFYRYNDTPGYKIPQLYFDFLANGFAEPLEGVFIHNRLDVISLLLLMNSIQVYLQDAERFRFYSPQDALQIAKFFYRKRDLDLSRQVAHSQFNGLVNDEVGAELGFHLGRMQKRLALYDQALETFKKLIGCRGEAKLYAYESAAKIYEHQVKDIHEAHKITSLAIEYLDSPLAGISPGKVMFWNETLQKRQKRLIRKMK